MIPLFGLLFLLSSGPCAAGSLRLVGHVGGALVEEGAGGLEHEWTSGVADLAVEYRFVGPLSLGAGGEVLLNEGRLEIAEQTAAFAYVKVRPGLPFRPYLGAGLEARKGGGPFRGDDGGTWRRGYVVMGGVGLKISKVSLDLEVRRVDTDMGNGRFRFWSLRPGLTLWF